MEVVDVVEVVVGGAGVELVEGGLEEVLGEELELEDEDPPLQGWEDSKSTAPKRSRVDRPPQVSAELPVHGMLH